MKRDLNEEARRVHAANAKWWIDPFTEKPIQRNVLEMGALAISELSEALEGHRKNKMDDKLPQYPMPVVELVDCVIRVLDTVNGLGFEIDQYRFDSVLGCGWSKDLPFGAYIFCLSRGVINLYESMLEQLEVPEEAANIIWLCIWISEKFFPEIDFWTVYEAKMKFNAEREDHKLEHRRGEHGKKY